MGYRTIKAPDRETGLKASGMAGKVDLLVANVDLLNSMNGRQVADAARALRPGPKVPFITGYAENAVFGHGHRGPGLHVLTRPSSVDGLATKVCAIIGAT